MSWWLAKPEDPVRQDWLKRFDARYWTVDFPRPMMAAVTTTAPDALRVDTVFYRSGDLAGLIWASEDRIDHPLLRYATSRDYRRVQLTFRWRSGGIIPLDAVYGPTLTIEGRDEQGRARAWYVRLWNYATGSPGDATVTLDFGALAGGFLLPSEADPVWAGDIDRMFISLAPPGYDGGSTPLAAAAGGWAELSGIRATGSGSTLRVNDGFLPEHRFRAATAYDDQYNLTPERLLRNVEALGYRKWLNHYVGMSHQFRLGWNATEQRFVAVDAVQPYNTPFLAWHRDLAARAGQRGLALILSLSFELFAEHAPQAWQQRRADASPALTGWSPPSALLSPAVPEAQSYLQHCAAALAGIAVSAGQRARIQIGEPWWWVGPDGEPCIHDRSVTALYRAQTGREVPPAPYGTGTLSAAQRNYLAWAGGVLASSTAGVLGAARAVAPDTERLLLFYAPQVLTGDGRLTALNMPDGWGGAALDVFQYEDYDFVLAGAWSAQRRAEAAVRDRLGYPLDKQHYFSGFVLSPQDVGKWAEIVEAAETAMQAGYAETFLWSMPQIMRDGFCYFAQGADEMGFDDVLFPVELGLDAVTEPAFLTQVVTTVSGHEFRNSNWADAKLRFEVGSGLRSEDDLRRLAAFFRARRGMANGFRFRDPLDHSSAVDGGDPSALDQLLGTGDEVRTRFELRKSYDAEATRRITRPVGGSVRVAVAGREQGAGWVLRDGGVIDFDDPPAAGAAVTAGFLFDVPVRFGEDRLTLSLAAFKAGQMPALSLLEIRED